MPRIKKIQDGYTSVEQSERLLELGVPEDSADCFYEMSYRPIRQLLPDGILFSELPQYMDDEDGDLDILPCWSTGQLIEIYLSCVKSDKFVHNIPYVYLPNMYVRTVIEQMLDMYEASYANHEIDFEKLIVK